MQINNTGTAAPAAPVTQEKPSPENLVGSLREKGKRMLAMWSAAEYLFDVDPSFTLMQQHVEGKLDEYLDELALAIKQEHISLVRTKLGQITTYIHAMQDLVYDSFFEDEDEDILEGLQSFLDASDTEFCE